MDMRISSCVWTAPAHSCPEWKGRDQFRLREGRWGGGREGAGLPLQAHLLPTPPPTATSGFLWVRDCIYMAEPRDLGTTK